jgi:hypothetical protein
LSTQDTFSLLERVEGGVVRSRRDDLDIDRGGGSTAAVGYDDFEVELGLPGPAGFHEWISDTLVDGPVRRSGAVHVTDREYRSVHVREFVSAVITAVTFPACDAKSKEPASIRATFRPDAIRQRRGDLGTIKLSPGHSMWQDSNFSVTVEGLPSAHVSRVDSFTWTQTIARDGSRVVEVPNIVLTLPVTELSSWEAWVQDAMISGESLFRAGTIIYLDQDLKDGVGRVELAGLVPISLKPPIGDANIEEIARFTIELSCQRLRFEPT